MYMYENLKYICKTMFEFLSSCLNGILSSLRSCSFILLGMKKLEIHICRLVIKRKILILFIQYFIAGHIFISVKIRRKGVGK